MSDALVFATTMINGRPLKYTIRRSKRARRARVRACLHQGIVLVLPWSTAAAAVPELLDYWADWMDAKADELGVRLGPRTKEYATGSTVKIYGEPCLIEVVAAPQGCRKSHVERDGDLLRLILKPADVLHNRPVLEAYLRDLAKTDLVERVARWAAVVGVMPKSVRVKNQMGRWGSCSGRGNLNFCFRLVMAPPRVFDAIVAHELCHLVHLNHGPDFQTLLTAVCPGHREVGAWLRAHGDELVF